MAIITSGSTEFNFWYEPRREIRRPDITPTCNSCGLTHGASKFVNGKCEITLVKELEAKEAIEKKHNENIRKLYWERYITQGL